MTIINTGIPRWAIPDKPEPKLKLVYSAPPPPPSNEPVERPASLIVLDILDYLQFRCAEAEGPETAKEWRESIRRIQMHEHRVVAVNDDPNHWLVPYLNKLIRTLFRLVGRDDTVSLRVFINGVEWKPQDVDTTRAGTIPPPPPCRR